jgi:hypothetical protein
MTSIARRPVVVSLAFGLFASGVLAFSLFASGFSAAPRPTGSSAVVVRGWLSDEGCARGRASGGVYTGTNPDCAKQCVAQGKKIVLIDPVAKAILNIGNQDAARKNIGDYVEVTGTLDSQSQTLQIGSLKMLTKGKAMCELPKSGK